MKSSAMAVLAFAGAMALAGVAGCQSTGDGSSPSSSPSVNVTQVVQTTQSDIQTGCAVLRGAIPSATSIIAIVDVADPAIVVAGNAVQTGLNIANAICTAYGQTGASSALAKATPVTVDGIVITFQK